MVAGKWCCTGPLQISRNSRDAVSAAVKARLGLPATDLCWNG